MQHQVAAQEAVDRNAAPIAQRIADLDGRIGELKCDGIGRHQARPYPDGDGARRAAECRARRAGSRPSANRRAAGCFEGARGYNVEALRARITTEAGPALYLAKLFGSDDTKAMLRLITAMLAVLLTLAAASAKCGKLARDSAAIPRIWASMLMRTRCLL